MTRAIDGCNDARSKARDGIAPLVPAGSCTPRNKTADTWLQKRDKTKSNGTNGTRQHQVQHQRYQHRLNAVSTYQLCPYTAVVIVPSSRRVKRAASYIPKYAHITLQPTTHTAVVNYCTAAPAVCCCSRIMLRLCSRSRV